MSKGTNSNGSWGSAVVSFRSTERQTDLVREILMTRGLGKCRALLLLALGWQPMKFKADDGNGDRSS